MVQVQVDQVLVDQRQVVRHATVRATATGLGPAGRLRPKSQGLATTGSATRVS